MSVPENERHPHFILTGTSETQAFRPRGDGRGGRVVPERDRAQHGGALRQQIDALAPAFEVSREARQAVGLDRDHGLQIEFESLPDVELAFESLADDRSHIELLNVRRVGERILATVFVPNGKLVVFERKLTAYLEERRDKNGKAIDHRKLIDAIQEIRTASLQALWTDDPAVFPQSDDEIFWWEVWLPVRGDRIGTVDAFRAAAQALDLPVAPGTIEFPERTVLLMRASAGRVKESMLVLNSVAELRRAKETAEFFDSMPLPEQAEWIDELLGRTAFPAAGDAVPHVCLLDTGVNQGHPLLAPALSAPDLHTVEPAWGVDDEQGHGTGMAGLALLGDLAPVLASDGPVTVVHRLESVKLLRDAAGNANDSRLHGYLTVEAVARPEITAPVRLRSFALAITARDNRDRGRPSAWSAAVDRLASDAETLGERPRLLLVAAGNIDDLNAWMEYPASNTTDGVHDPGQAWNALTVGAFTNLVTITGDDVEGYAPIAPAGGLSPFSTTSATWAGHWPMKPDVVFEGGNAAKDGLSAVWLHSLSLLTTHHRTNQRLLTTFNATSAATALAARMAAEIMAQYPDLWPETVRGLIVHSAEWTEAMRDAWLPAGADPTKRDYATLVRHCGFGVPDLGRALWTVADSVTMVVEDRLHPFEREGSKQPKMRDMHLHRLPWPLEELEALGEIEVEMRVTLSYFIEPSPSVRGPRSRYRYESHGLRFDVKRADESESDFRARLNALARDEEEGTASRAGDAGWLVGPQQRHRGSLHCDIWKGTAADLASRGVLAVFPTTGWWKTRPAQQRYDQPARYSLLVSIRAPEVDVDLYVAVSNRIGVPVQVQT